ncbi:MAG: cell wall hydrolase [Candidatus Methanomethylicaceae archaeon]
MKHIEPLQKLGDIDILLALVAGEAAGEPFLGKVAVCYVAINRQRLASAGAVKSWPRTLHGVILQKHQFSCFWSDWDLRRGDIELAICRHPSMRECLRAAVAAYTKTVADPTFGADHYHSVSIKPPQWTRSMLRTVKIGRHVFYAAYRY